MKTIPPFFFLSLTELLVIYLLYYSQGRHNVTVFSITPRVATMKPSFLLLPGSPQCNRLFYYSQGHHNVTVFSITPRVITMFFTSFKDQAKIFFMNNIRSFVTKWWSFIIELWYIFAMTFICQQNNHIVNLSYTKKIALITQQPINMQNTQNLRCSESSSFLLFKHPYGFWTHPNGDNKPEHFTSKRKIRKRREWIKKFF